MEVLCVASSGACLVFFACGEAVGCDFGDFLLMDGVDVAVVDIGFDVAAFDDNGLFGGDGAVVFEVGFALGDGFFAGVFEAIDTDDGVVADDVPFDVFVDFWEGAFSVAK